MGKSTYGTDDAALLPTANRVVQQVSNFDVRISRLEMLKMEANYAT